jgi:hypothetical protein
MSISRERLGFGMFACMVVAGLALTLSAGGCGEQSSPAATRPIDEAVAPTSGAPTSAATTNGPQKPGSPVAPAAASRPQPIRNITFDTVKLNLKKDEPFRSEVLTPAVKKLDGNRIRIRGYILPPPQQSGLTRFVLVRDNMACCFGPGAAIYDSMIVQMPKGLTMDYTVQPVMVEGTFNIQEVRFPSGRCMSIYHVKAEKAQ